jgi:hypothetical protein
MKGKEGLFSTFNCVRMSPLDGRCEGVKAEAEPKRNVRAAATFIATLLLFTNSQTINNKATF